MNSGGGSDARVIWSRLREAYRRFDASPHKPALVIALVVAVMAGLFAASYSLALGDPKPHHVPIGVVTGGPALSDPEAVVDALNQRTDGGFVVREFDTTTSALTALDEQTIYAVVAQTGEHEVTLYLSSASGSSVARLLEQDAPRFSGSGGWSVTIVDRHPLGKYDPSGITLFYVALAAVIAGFVGAVQARVNAAGLSLRAELGWDLVRSLLGGLSIVLAISVILSLLPLPVWQGVAVLALTMMVTGLTLGLFRLVVGPKWALLPTWLLLVVISNPSSGGAVAPELLPGPYEFMGRWLPTGATVRALRDLTYFPDNLHAEPFVVLCVWMVVVGALFVVVRIHRQGTGKPPATPRPWRRRRDDRVESPSQAR